MCYYHNMDSDTKQYIDEKFEYWGKEFARILRTSLEASETKMQALLEDTNSNIEAVYELVSDSQEVRKSANTTQEQVATNTEDIAVNRSLLKNHEQRIKVLER